MNMIHKTPANIAQPEPLISVVWFYMMKSKAIAISNPSDKTVTSQMIILGRNNPKSIISKLNPTEISTAQRSNYMALCEFHLS